MTPALKAMVEAMAKEIERQEIALNSDDSVSPMTLEDLDLEKVARAGLEAIRWPDDANVRADIILSGADVPDSVARFWPPMIDAILKEPHA